MKLVRMYIINHTDGGAILYPMQPIPPGHTVVKFEIRTDWSNDWHTSTLIPAGDPLQVFDAMERAKHEILKCARKADDRPEPIRFRPTKSITG
jgi:hypothetical protein